MSDPQSNDFHRLEIHQWEGEGYRPFVSYSNWVVALMNWEPRFDLNVQRTVERHNETDEVFVLTHGRSILFIDTDAEIQAVDMQPGVIYNVTRGTWHNVIGTKDASWLIVESRNTSEENSDYRQLSAKEIETLKAQFPAWLDGE
jgi:mannose-6-phosphate isomerase-like protein (cupin superfamily)